MIEEEKVKKEHKTTKTRVNENKKSRRNLLTVDDLFYELADIANQEQSIKEKLYKRIIGFIYYPYSKYEMLIEKFQSKILKTYFFTAGKLYKNEFVKLKEYGYAILSGKKSDIKLRIYPFNDDIINKLKTITWETKKSGCYSEYIGIKASMKGISKESTITYIELNAFEIDVDNYRYI